jgi:hypothetical protein
MLWLGRLSSVPVYSEERLRLPLPGEKHSCADLSENFFRHPLFCAKKYIDVLCGCKGIFAVSLTGFLTVHFAGLRASTQEPCRHSTAKLDDPGIVRIILKCM